VKKRATRALEPLAGLPESGVSAPRTIQRGAVSDSHTIERDTPVTGAARELPDSSPDKKSAQN
jgi:hypothetical protein